MYEIFTDSGACLTDEQIEKASINMISMNYVMDEKLYPSYIKGNPDNLKEVYRLLREGKKMTTTSLNTEEFVAAFTPVLEKGKDILYLSFSSAMSGNYSCSLLAVEELQKKFPERRISVVDTLGGCSGQGILAYSAGLKRIGGMSMDDIANWVEDTKLKIEHWFTVEDLKFLFRGGRLSRLSCIIGTIAGIKPMLHLNEKGMIVSGTNVIGRKKSINKLVELTTKVIDPNVPQIIFINHADCPADAAYLLEKIKEKITAEEYHVNMLDPVMGVHAGPGSIAVFCVASEKRRA